MKKIILLLITVISLLSITQIIGAIEKDELSGILIEGSCKKEFYIGTITVFFGPYRYIRSTTALYDYDDDGNTETIYKELCGLVLKGEEVTLGGWYKTEDYFNVLTINGLLYRESGPPPWI